jgi:hypothetical protein
MISREPSPLRRRLDSRKLKAGDIDKIRQRYAEGEKARVIAEAFHISTKYVQELVVSRKPRRKS